jgi:hypothetical protein
VRRDRAVHPRSVSPLPTLLLANPNPLAPLLPFRNNGRALGVAGRRRLFWWNIILKYLIVFQWSSAARNRLQRECACAADAGTLAALAASLDALREEAGCAPEPEPAPGGRGASLGKESRPASPGGEAGGDPRTKAVGEHSSEPPPAGRTGARAEAGGAAGAAGVVGREVTLHLIDTWGDAHYIGLSLSPPPY